MYTEMQTIESNYRSKHLADPILLRHAVNNEFDIVGIPSGDERFPMTWLILDPHGKPTKIYKMPPDGGLTISCGFIDYLKSQVTVDSNVERLLRSNCGK
jgi:hypothetical protein